MPLTIAVAGANSKVGRLLVPLLLDRGHAVTALVRAPADLPGARVVADWMQSPAAVAAIAEADAVVNPTGEINPKTRAGYAEANVVPARRLLDARAGRPADVAVMVGWAVAREGSGNAFHAAKLAAEALTRATGRRAVLLRASSVMGTPEAPWDFERNLRAPPGKPGRAFGDGTARLRPVLGRDLALLIAEAVEGTAEGVLAAEGSDTLTLDGYVRLVNRDPAKPVGHTPGWLALALAPLIGMRRDMVRLFLRDALEPAPNAFKAVGREAESVKRAWA